MITISNMKDNGRFTLELMRTTGDAFIKVYGCKVVDHNGKRFVSGPAFKGQDDKWVNQTWMDDKLQEQIIAAVDALKPVEEAFSDEDEIPF